MNTAPPEWRASVTEAAVSPSSRKMFFGFHSLSTATITTMQVSELRMSVSSGPMCSRDVELHAGERDAAGDDGRQHFQRALRPRP